MYSFILTGNWRGGAEGKPKSNALYFIHELFRQGREIEACEKKRVRHNSKNLEVVERKSIFSKSELQIE